MGTTSNRDGQFSADPIYDSIYQCLLFELCCEFSLRFIHNLILVVGWIMVQNFSALQRTYLTI